MEQTTKIEPEGQVDQGKKEIPVLEQPRDSERDWRRRRSRLRNPRVRMALLVGGVVLIAVGILLWRYFSSYESTDDAQIDGHLNSVSARISGHVQKLLVSDNQYVEAGTPLVQIDPTDYEVALDRAKANYAAMLAAARGAQANVPITSVGTAGQLSAAQPERLECARWNCGGKPAVTGIQSTSRAGGSQ